MYIFNIPNYIIKILLTFLIIFGILACSSDDDKSASSIPHSFDGVGSLEYEIWFDDSVIVDRGCGDENGKIEFYNPDGNFVHEAILDCEFFRAKIDDIPAGKNYTLVISSYRKENNSDEIRYLLIKKNVNVYANETVNIGLVTLDHFYSKIRGPFGTYTTEKIEFKWVPNHEESISYHLEVPELNIDEWLTETNFIIEDFVAPSEIDQTSTSFFPFPDTGQKTRYTPIITRYYEEVDGEDAAYIETNDRKDYNFPSPNYKSLDINSNEITKNSMHVKWSVTTYDKRGKHSTSKSTFKVFPSMVYDNVTGLTWECKTFDGGTHHKEIDVPYEDAHKYISKLNEIQFGGYSDWRLPNIQELATLVYCNFGYRMIDNKIFQNTQLEEDLSSYWTSVERADYEHSAWFIDFHNGYIDEKGKQSEHFVRAVRGIPLQPNHFEEVRNADENVYAIKDYTTNLMWRIEVGESMDWESALIFSELLDYEGYKDWRLPSRNELQSIIDYSRVKPAISELFQEFKFDQGYWTSTTYPSDRNYAFVAYFEYGKVYISHKFLEKQYVVTVRNIDEE